MWFAKVQTYDYFYHNFFLANNKKTVMGRTQLLTVISLVAIVLTGCKTYNDFEQERLSLAALHYGKARESVSSLGKTLTLKDCLSMSLENNLDLKVLALESDVAKEAASAEMLSMLPELTINNNYNSRSNVLASSSKNVVGGTDGTYSFSTSQDRNVNTFNFDMAFSILDFGLAFCNSRQAKDREFLKNQTRLRMRQNLMLDTSRAYFQVAASQSSIESTRKLLKECRERYETIAKLGETGKITPDIAFSETRRLVEMEKRLQNHISQYDNNCVQLCSLMGIYPDSRIKVDLSILDKVPEFVIPEQELLEKIALYKRPELLEIDIRKHINLIESRKALLSMFPNVKLFASYSDSNNSFLYNSTWWDVGVKATLNLLNLPGTYKRYKSSKLQMDAEEMRAYSQAVAIMAQVAMARTNITVAKERLDNSQRMLDTCSKQYANARKSSKVSAEISQLQLEHIKMLTAEATLERDRAVGDYFVAYCRLVNVMGLESLSKESVEQLAKTLGYSN